MPAQAGSARDDAVLAEAAEAWLPTADPQARALILGFLQQAAASGLDPIGTLRDGLRAWFGPQAEVAVPTVTPAVTPATPGSIAIEPLAPQRRPTMWPQRPKRLPDELFSSWLWRASVAARIPPAKFTRETRGLLLTDIDRDVAPATLRRLAQRSGQSVAHLAAGTISAAFMAADDTPAGVIAAVLLRDGRFLPLKDGSPFHDRRLKSLQYCPLCLATDARPHFRRAWRFSLSIVCPDHGCLLRDGCPYCGAPIDPMTQRHVGLQPHCGICDARLSEASVTNVPLGKRRQRSLNALLLYLGLHIAPAERPVHLDALLRHFRVIPEGAVAVRARYLRDLQSTTLARWFSEPQRSEHMAPLQLLARGMPYEKWLRRRSQLTRTYSRLAGQDFVASMVRAYYSPRR
jgi:hypothetical protein